MEEGHSNISSYQKGFNEGYIITKYEPSLSDMISLLKNVSLRGEGFRDGRQQFVLEQTRDRHPSWLTSNNRLQKSQEEKSKDRDIEDH
jgi:hypothetical protein